MKQKFLFMLAVVLPFLCGCSKSSSQKSAEISTDLGVIEVTDRGARHFPLSGGRDCQITFTSLANDQVLVEAAVVQTNSQGDVTIIARPRKEARFGEKVTLPIGEGSVVITPKRL